MGSVKPSSISGVLGQATSISGIKSLMNGELQSNPVYIDSVISISSQKGSEVSNYKIETGSFVSYNKVEKPRQVTIRMTKGGTEEERALFISWLETRAKGYTKERTRIKRTSPNYSYGLYQNNTFDIYVPEVHYANMTLVEYTIDRNADSGSSLIIADCVFVEIREVAPIYIKSKTSNSKNPSDVPSLETSSVVTNSPSPNALSKAKSAFNKAKGFVGL